MAEEVDPGVAYLMALKKSATAEEGHAAASAKGSEPSSVDSATIQGQRYSGTEKRRSARFQCDGSAEIREEGCDVRTWATFTDIGLYGCYIEAQATYPPGTILHLKLEVNGVRVESKANVRVSYPYLGMGIAFVDMSHENMDQLKRLLATISPPSLIMGPGIASSLPASGSVNAIPPITDPAGALQSLIEFFESRQMLMREDFLRLLKKSQK